MNQEELTKKIKHKIDEFITKEKKQFVDDNDEEEDKQTEKPFSFGVFNEMKRGSKFKGGEII